MKSAADLFIELDYWIFIGVGQDIVNMPEQRPEYQHLVLRFPQRAVAASIPELVRSALYYEATKPLILQSTFWHQVKLSFKQWLTTLNLRG